MNAKPIGPGGSDSEGRVNTFPLVLGALLGLALLKFGNAVIMEGQITWPKGGFEWLLATWPVVIGYGLLAAVGLLGLTVARKPSVRHGWLMALPPAWLLWQFLAATQTVDARLTARVLPHFIGCVACFALGFYALGRARSPGRFWGMMGAALLLVLLAGFQQRFGGLAETRAFLQQHQAAHWRDLPPEQAAEMERNGLLLRTPDGYTAHPGLLKKAESSRISSTLFYPNSLAGALLLLLPPCLAALATTPRLTRPARGLALALFGGGALACLYWSGSKAGWLLMLVLGALALLRGPWGWRLKCGVIAGVLALGLLAFGVKYAGFFRQGATSVVARFDYWQAAWQTARDHPLLGTGPGTFMRSYERIKRPDAEMARLAHNDYLQQASDSGWPGFALYTAFVVCGLTVTGRAAVRETGWQRFSVWLGTLGWALQGVVEFGLYIPALSWSAFALLGWLLRES